MRNQELLELLAESEGYDEVQDMLEAATFDSVAPGICTQCREYTTEVEPDCRDGYCENCEANRVQSCLILAGII